MGAPKTVQRRITTHSAPKGRRGLASAKLSNCPDDTTSEEGRRAWYGQESSRDDATGAALCDAHRLLSRAQELPDSGRCHSTLPSAPRLAQASAASPRPTPPRRHPICPDSPPRKSIVWSDQNQTVK